MQTRLPTVLSCVCAAGGFTCSFLLRFHKSCRPISCHEHFLSIVSHDFIQLSLTDPGLKPSFPPVASFPLSSPNQAQFLEICFLFLEVIQISPLKVTPISQQNTLFHLLFWSYSSGLSQEVALICFFLNIVFIYSLCLSHSILFIFLFLTICPCNLPLTIK